MLMIRSAGPLATTWPPEVEIRPIVRSDLAAVAASYCATYRGTPHEMTTAEAGADIEAAWAGECGAWDHRASLLAVAGGGVVGAILLVTDPPWDDVPPGLFISDLFVAPVARRRGIARALVVAALGVVDGEVRLRVEDANLSARALYEALGFTAG